MWSERFSGTWRARTGAKEGNKEQKEHQQTGRRKQCQSSKQTKEITGDERGLDDDDYGHGERQYQYHDPGQE